MNFQEFSFTNVQMQRNFGFYLSTDLASYHRTILANETLASDDAVFVCSREASILFCYFDMSSSCYLGFREHVIRSSLSSLRRSYCCPMRLCWFSASSDSYPLSWRFYFVAILAIWLYHTEKKKQRHNSIVGSFYDSGDVATRSFFFIAP